MLNETRQESAKLTFGARNKMADAIVSAGLVTTSIAYIFVGGTKIRAPPIKGATGYELARSS